MSVRTRLHITPLNPTLLSIVLPPAILAAASSISYHTLQTFPERNYGYVDLPTVEAEKLKKKLNGSILRGSKMRVEEARPERTVRKSEIRDLPNPDHAKEKVKVAKKRKWEGDVLSGYELPENRKVKRGWTEPAKRAKEYKAEKTGKGKGKQKLEEAEKERKSKVQTSSFTEAPECLFHTKLPQSADGLVVSPGKVKTRKKQSGKSNGTVVVHEFSNTTKHAAFLRVNQATNGNTAASEYVKGKGWVNQDGVIVEGEVRSRRTRLVGETASMANESSSTKPETSSSPISLKAKVVSQPETSTNLDDTSSSAMTSNSEGSCKSDDGDEITTTHKRFISCSEDLSVCSFASKRSSADESRNEKADPQSAGGDQAKPLPSGEHNFGASSVDVTPPPTATEVHPLEALFKRPKQASSSTPKKPNLEVQTSFSFFDIETDDHDILHPTIPQTPFTQRDFQQRRMRSAAPTPDTAAPSKMGFGRVWGDGGEVNNKDDDEHEGDRASINTPLARKDPSSEGDEAERTESEFSKWFWEHRGETNRAWKKRRREAAKEKRQKDNKRRSRSIV